MTTAAVARFRMEKDPAPGSSISAFLEFCLPVFQRGGTLVLNSSTKCSQRCLVAVANASQCLHQLLVDLELGTFVNPVGMAAFDLTEQGVANARIL